MKLSEHLERIARADTPKRLDVALWNATEEYPRSREKIRWAVSERGAELCRAHPGAEFVPVVGKRRRLSLCGQTYRVGYGGNSTGERYCWHYAREWVAGKLRAAGMTARERQQIDDWCFSLYPHRVLSAVDSFLKRRGG